MSTLSKVLEGRKLSLSPKSPVVDKGTQQKVQVCKVIILVSQPNNLLRNSLDFYLHAKAGYMVKLIGLYIRKVYLLYLL